MTDPSPPPPRPRHRCRRPRPLDRLAPRRSTASEVARRRQDRRRRRRVGHRLRRHPQQLLPAGDVGADGRLRRGVGIRPGGAPLPRHRLHRARPARPGERPDRGVRAPAADRLPLRAVRRRGGGRSAHALAVRRLARARPDRLPARARRRLRVQPRVDVRARRQGPRGRAPRSTPASRSPASTSTAPARSPRVQHQRRPDRRRPGRRRRRPVGRVAVGDARPPGSPRRPPARRHGREDLPMWTYWYLQEGELEIDPARVRHRPTAAHRRCCTSTATSRCTTTTGG